MDEIRKYKYVVLWGPAFTLGGHPMRASRESVWTESYVELAYTLEEGRQQLEAKLQEAIFQRRNGLIGGPLYAKDEWATIAAMWPLEAEALDPDNYPPARYRERDK